MSKILHAIEPHFLKTWSRAGPGARTRSCQAHVLS